MVEKGTREDLEKADEQEEFFKWMEENPNAGVALNENDEDEELEYDHDGNIIVPDKNKVSRNKIINIRISD